MNEETRDILDRLIEASTELNRLETAVMAAKRKLNAVNKELSAAIYVNGNQVEWVGENEKVTVDTGNGYYLVSLDTDGTHNHNVLPIDGIVCL